MQQTVNNRQSMPHRLLSQHAPASSEGWRDGGFVHLSSDMSDNAHLRYPADTFMNSKTDAAHYFEGEVNKTLEMSLTSWITELHSRCGGEQVAAEAASFLLYLPGVRAPWRAEAMNTFYRVFWRSAGRQRSREKEKKNPLDWLSFVVDSLFFSPFLFILWLSFHVDCNCLSEPDSIVKI